MNHMLIEFSTNIRYIGDLISVRYTTYNKYVKEFENRLSEWYPLGKDVFRLDHGNNYFTFFRRMGVPFYYAIFDNDELIQGTICFILRKINNKFVFYLCDLKFDPLIRHTGLLKELLSRTVPNFIQSTNKFYAVSMNDPKNHNNNNILQMAKHMGKKFGINVESGTILNIYSLDFIKISSVEKLILSCKNKANNTNYKQMSYLSSEGIKDIIVKVNNTTSNMNLLHLYYFSSDCENNNFSKYYNKPLREYTHMFCTPIDSVLSQKLSEQNILPSSTATVLHYNMSNINWEFIQTCDI